MFRAAYGEVSSRFEATQHHLESFDRPRRLAFGSSFLPGKASRESLRSSDPATLSIPSRADRGIKPKPGRHTSLDVIVLRILPCREGQSPRNSSQSSGFPATALPTSSIRIPARARRGFVSIERNLKVQTSSPSPISAVQRGLLVGNPNTPTVIFRSFVVPRPKLAPVDLYDQCGVRFAEGFHDTLDAP